MKFQLLTTTRCQICACELPERGICQDCLQWRKLYGDNLLRHQAVYKYNGAFHDLMVNYKRYGDYVLREVLQELCRASLSLIHADYYVPVPTSVEHIKQRQFDTISAIYGDIVPLTQALIKIEGLGAQGEKTRLERLKSPQSFKIAAGMRINFNQQKILLLDDIYTTGRTLYYARDALLAAFPKAQIESFSICR